MRVLVSAVPALGHVAPVLDLACSLKLAGHEVRFATHAQRHAGVMAPSTLADLGARMSEWPPDVVVHDEGEYAGPVAAMRADIPWVTHAWGSPLRPVSELTELEELASDLWKSCGLDVPPAAGLYAHALVKPCPPGLQDHPEGADVVWPIRPRPLDDRGPQLQADAYIGFGTVPSFATAPAELDAAVRACTSRGMRVVVTAPTADLRSRLGEIDRNLVEAQEFVSLPPLIRSCRVVISHVGAGTVLASLAAGVPLVIVDRCGGDGDRTPDCRDARSVGDRSPDRKPSPALELTVAGRRRQLRALRRARTSTGCAARCQVTASPPSQSKSFASAAVRNGCVMIGPSRLR